MLLDREEYIEQAYFFQTLRERMQQSMSTQDLLLAAKQEILATTQLPYAIDFMASELRLTGGFATAMARLPHYFTTFQTYLVAEAEKAEGRFDFRIALEILQREAEYRAKDPSVQGIFLFQFESDLPQPAGLRPRTGRHRRRRNLRRRLAGVDFDRPPAGRAGRFLRHDLRPQRAVPQNAGRRRKTGALRREGRPHRAGEPAKRPALSVRRAAAPPRLSVGAAPERGGHQALSSSRRCKPKSIASKCASSSSKKILHGGINLNRFYGPQGEQKKVD